MSTPTNTPTSKLDEVRTKVIEALPERECVCGEHSWGADCSPITLADVLMAIHKTEPWEYFLDMQGGFWKWSKSGKDPELLGSMEWNLPLPLDEQEPEVIEFLHKILCV